MNGEKYAVPFPIFLAVSVGMIVMSLLFYLQFHQNNSLPILPALTLKSGSADSRSAAPTTSALPESLYYPYYYGAPVYVYQYNLATQFPSIGTDTMVYKIAGASYDRAAATALAQKFSLTGDPIAQDNTYVFTEGTTPDLTPRSTPGSTGSGSSGASDTNTATTVIDTTEPSKPTPEETLTGRVLTVTSEGSISYYDYSVGRTTVPTPLEGDTKIQTQLPDGVASTNEAINLAEAFLRSTGLLPADYDAVAADPYGSVTVSITPKHGGYAIQAGVISVEIGNDGKIASLYTRSIVITDFHQYPTKTASETLALETLTYTIKKVELTYASSYDTDGIEYAQPVYTLTGTDSLGNDFTFQVPAVKAEFLQNPIAMPLAKDSASGL